MNSFALALIEELNRQGVDFGELPDLLEEHGAPVRDTRPSTIAAALHVERISERPAWHPKTWAALNTILSATREEFVGLLWLYYVEGEDAAHLVDQASEDSGLST